MNKTNNLTKFGLICFRALDPDYVPLHRYTYKVSPERIYGAMLPNGSWTGLMGMMLSEVRENEVVDVTDVPSMTQNLH